MANRTYVSLKHASVNSGVAVQIMCTVVGVTFNKKNDKTPNAEYAQYPAAVQTGEAFDCRQGMGPVLDGRNGPG